jgi:hypothetical protein
MDIYTSQLSNWRRVLAFGVEIVDITARTGLHVFAPEIQHVMAYKNGVMTQAEYTEYYINRMRQSFRQNQVAWQSLKTKSNVCFVCYCSPNGFCHRHIFVDLLSKYLTKEGVPHVLKGELV